MGVGAPPRGERGDSSGLAENETMIKVSSYPDRILPMGDGGRATAQPSLHCVS